VDAGAAVTSAARRGAAPHGRRFPRSEDGRVRYPAGTERAQLRVHPAGFGPAARTRGASPRLRRGPATRGGGDRSRRGRTPAPHRRTPGDGNAAKAVRCIG
jgi:hypothetical protein